MNLSISPSLPPLLLGSSSKGNNYNNESDDNDNKFDKFQLQRPPSSRQRRRSNSSSNILASTVNVKVVRSPAKRDANFDNTSNNNNIHTNEYHKLHSSSRTIPRPPRLAFDTSFDTSVDLRMPMTPPSRQEYKAHHQSYQHMLSPCNPNSHRDYQGLTGKESRTTSFSSTKSNKSNKSSLSMNKVLSAFYNERIEKQCRRGQRRNRLTRQVSMLRKEIDVVKSSLAGLQKDHKVMLDEKKQLEQQYQEAKYEVTKTLENSANDLMEYNELLNAKMEKLTMELGVISSTDNSPLSPLSDDNGIISGDNGEWPLEYENIMNNCVQQAKKLEYLQAELEKSKRDFRLLLDFKEEIEKTLEDKEREYLEQIRHCEAVTNGQSGMIDSMEKLLRELEDKMDKLLLEKSGKRQERIGKHKHNSSAISHLSASNIIGEKHERKRAHRVSVDIKKGSPPNNYSIDNSPSYTPAEELVPAYCLAPPQTRRQSYTNPISLFTDEERIRHQSRFCLAKRWVEDDEVSICQHSNCSVKFNLWNRRHHCRRCGNIFCNTHSAYSMLLFPDGSEDWGGVWSRVCEGCFSDTK
ncbi:17807_t:CDS:2 [Funneliformis geosporum]|uniref:6951_t:CDS:1 n=1 Tax=Funneliformis geosporum TaxID=1117311 RepID=A0A9W4SR46_9GLOM|nr:17807_t:CDS:2 [Funneliformis geosporum]CAI2178572.1 6951_t:CDS:2 [Funneliformis geosporum]